MLIGNHCAILFYSKSYYIAHLKLFHKLAHWKLDIKIKYFQFWIFNEICLGDVGRKYQDEAELLLEEQKYVNGIEFLP